MSSSNCFPTSYPSSWAISLLRKAYLSGLDSSSYLLTLRPNVLRTSTNFSSLSINSKVGLKMDRLMVVALFSLKFSFSMFNKAFDCDFPWLISLVIKYTIVSLVNCHLAINSWGPKSFSFSPANPNTLLISCYFSSWALERWGPSFQADVPWQSRDRRS